MDTITYIKSSIENYESLIVKFEKLSKMVNERLSKLENNVDITTESLLKDFGEEIPINQKKTTKKKSKLNAPIIENKNDTEPETKTETEPEIKPKIEPEIKKKFETVKDFFIYDFPLNKNVYKEFIPSKVSLNLTPEEVLKKTAVKSNSKLEEFKLFLKNRKDEYNSSIF